MTPNDIMRKIERKWHRANEFNSQNYWMQVYNLLEGMEMMAETLGQPHVATNAYFLKEIAFEHGLNAKNN